jgi:hypothetical protein
VYFWIGPILPAHAVKKTDDLPIISGFRIGCPGIVS